MCFINLFSPQLQQEQHYTLEEVDKIYLKKTGNSNERVYHLKVRLSYCVNRKKHLKITSIRIDQASNLRIGGIYFKNELKKPQEWQEYSLSEQLLDSELLKVQDSEYLSENHLVHSIDRSNESKVLSKRLCVYKLKEPIILKGESIHFISFPSFEIARFFLFDKDKYNHRLLESEFNNEDKKNLIYNPKLTKELSNSIKCVCLRSEINDVSARKAVDLAFNHRIKGQVKKLQSIINADGNFENFRTFFSTELPIEKFTEFKVLGNFGSNKFGDKGLIVQSIKKVNGYSEDFLFTRENDGRSANKNERGTKRSFKGFRSKSKSNSINNDDYVESSEIANPYFESHNLEFKDEFSIDEEERVVKKIEKQTQDYENDELVFSDKVNPSGASGGSLEGDANSKYQPLNVSNEYYDKKNKMKTAFWDKFPDLLNELKLENIVSRVEFGSTYQNKVTFNEKIDSKLTSIGKGGKKVFVKYYFAQTVVGNKYIYILEYDQRKFENSTIIIKNKKIDGPLNSNFLTELHRKIRNANGSTKYISSKIYDIKTVRHSYQKRNGGSAAEYFEPKEALKKHKDKIGQYIYELIRSV